MSNQDEVEEIVRGFEIFEAVAVDGIEGISLQAIVERVDSDVWRVNSDLRILEDEGFVERVPGKTNHWRPGPEMIALFERIDYAALNLPPDNAA